MMPFCYKFLLYGYQEILVMINW